MPESETFLVSVGSEIDKKAFMFCAKYTVSLNGALISDRVVKFGVKTKKELDLISIALALSDCYMMGITNLKVLCNYDCSKLCSNTWQSKIIRNKLDETSKNRY